MCTELLTPLLTNMLLAPKATGHSSLYPLNHVKRQFASKILSHDTTLITHASENSTLIIKSNRLI